MNIYYFRESEKLYAIHMNSDLKVHSFETEAKGQMISHNLLVIKCIIRRVDVVKKGRYGKILC